MSKRVAIVQSNYLPWKGYFDLIRAADVFVLYDDVQYTKNDWRNRNRVKTSSGLQWLTIPVRHVSLHQRIMETRTVDHRWRKSHWTTLLQVYGKTPHFELYRRRLEQFYLDDDEVFLSRINERLLREIADMLGIRTSIRRVDEFDLPAGKTERLVELCLQLKATEYLSGPAAKCYLDEDIFSRSGITVRYADYSGYPEYEQSHMPFEHAVTVLDLLFHMGPRAQDYLKNIAASPFEVAAARRAA